MNQPGGGCRGDGARPSASAERDALVTALRVAAVEWRDAYEHVRRTAVAALRAGAPYSAVSEAVGIPKATAINWFGRKADLVRRNP